MSGLNACHLVIYIKISLNGLMCHDDKLMQSWFLLDQSVLSNKPYE